MDVVPGPCEFIVRAWDSAAGTQPEDPAKIWNLKGYLDTIPKELEEAAVVDGASKFQVFRNVVLPLATPVLAVTALFGFIAGWGLLQREPWARVLAVVLAFISLFNIPFGTAIGVYTLWVLLPSDSQQQYDDLVAARAAA